MRVTSEDILSGPISPVLKRMTIPMCFALLAMMSFGIVDTWFISLLGTEPLAAVSFTFPVTFTIMNLSIGLGIATSVILAQVIGRKQMETAQRVCTDSLLFAVVTVLIVASLGLFTIDPLFRALGATDKTLPYIHDYMVIWYLGVGFLTLPMVGNSAIRATGDTKWPSILMMVSGMINAILDPLLIFGIGPFPELGVKGAALATVISWMVGFVVALWLLGHREKLLIASLPSPKQLLETWGKLIRIGTPVSLANMLSPITVMALTALVARYSETAVAGFGIGGRLESLLMIVSFALTSTLSPFMAQNIGAGNFQRAREALYISLKFVIGYQLFAALFLALTSVWTAQFFSNNPEVIEVTQQYLWIMPTGALFYALMMMYNTAFNAVHASLNTLFLSLARLLVCVLPCAWIGLVLYDLMGLFIGAVIGNALTYPLGSWLFHRVYGEIESKSIHANT